MAISTQSVGVYRGPVVAALRALLARIGANAQAALKALQMARMLSTLSSMSDHQLAQIGLARSDIPKYAEKLMADE